MTEYDMEKQREVELITADSTSQANWQGQLTLQDARRIYVGRGYPLFEKTFDLCDERGGIQPSFAVGAFFFGFMWFLYRKMYVEASIILGLALLETTIIPTTETGYLDLIASIVLSVILAIFGKGLYWKAVDRRIAKAMELYPHEPNRALQWLELKGGTNLWLPVILGILVVFVIWANIEYL